MQTRDVQGYDDKTDSYVTFGSLILSEPKNTVRAEPATDEILQWLMTHALFDGVGKPLIQPTDNPRWFENLDRVNGSLLWVTKVMVKR